MRFEINVILAMSEPEVNRMFQRNYHQAQLEKVKWRLSSCYLKMRPEDVFCPVLIECFCINRMFLNVVNFGLKMICFGIFISKTFLWHHKNDCSEKMR